MSFDRDVRQRVPQLGTRFASSIGSECRRTWRSEPDIARDVWVTQEQEGGELKPILPADAPLSILVWLPHPDAQSRNWACLPSKRGECSSTASGWTSVRRAARCCVARRPLSGRRTSLEHVGLTSNARCGLATGGVTPVGGKMSGPLVRKSDHPFTNAPRPLHTDGSSPAITDQPSLTTGPNPPESTPVQNASILRETPSDEHPRDRRNSRA